MKNLFFLLLSATLLTLTSCDKDCEPGSLESVIVGEWDLLVQGVFIGEVEFESDGTLVDPGDALIGGEINGVTLDRKSYTVHSDELFTVRAQNLQGTSSINADADVSSYTCDEIVANASGFDFTLRRKD